MFDVSNCVGFLTSHGSKTISESMNEFLKDSGAEAQRVQWTALYFVMKNPGVTQKELAEKMMVKTPTITELVNRMERDGLVDRTFEADNRKSRHLQITEKGLKEYYTILPLIESFNQKATADISEDEMEVFKKVLDKMLVNVCK